MGKFIDLTGKRFGRLTVIRQAEDHIQPSGQHKTTWLCKCDCGNEKNIIGDSLKKGVSQSCGCLQKRYNKYKFEDDICIGTTNQGKEFIFDSNMYDKVKDICWHTDDKGYVKGHYNGKDIFFHRFITDFKYPIVDHINRNPSDNRLCNLRACTQQENTWNRSLPSNNTSGVVGVTWDKGSKKWVACITVNKKGKRLGRYTNKEDAIKARKEAEEKYHGEFMSKDGLDEEK